VVLAPPRHKPTLADGITKAGRVMMCGTAWLARGVTTNWLNYQTPEACRARKFRLRCEAAELPYEVPVSLVYKIALKQTSVFPWVKRPVILGNHVANFQTCLEISLQHLKRNIPV
jgi:hypothetical protein